MLERDNLLTYTHSRCKGVQCPPHLDLLRAATCECFIVKSFVFFMIFDFANSVDYELGSWWDDKWLGIDGGCHCC